ncbi:MAG: carbohydrate kinase family protein [Patescibacteria group bacterium]
MQLDVITIGTATRDAFLKSKEFKRISTPEYQSGEGLCLPSGAKVEVDDIIFATGGGATNSAVTFARQGYHTACVCKIGNDVSGHEVLANLKSEGVSTVFAVQDENLKTAYSILLLSDSGERTILVYRGASEHFETSDINLHSLQAKWFYIAGSIPVKIVDAVLDQAKSIGAKTAINPSQSQIKLGLKGFGDVLKKIDVLIINREEGAYLTSVDYKKEDKIFKILDEHIKGIVVLTDGPKGSLVSDGKNIYKAGIYKEQKVVDRTGAGDAYGAGFVSGLIEDEKNIERAIMLASANAASVVESIGAKTGIISREDFEKSPRWKKLQIEINPVRQP